MEEITDEEPVKSLDIEIDELENVDNLENLSEFESFIDEEEQSECKTSINH